MRQNLFKSKEYENKKSNNSYFHDTLLLLKKYRDVVWSVELSEQQLRKRFEMQYGTSVDELLETIHLSGVKLDANLENHANHLERSNKILKIFDSAIELLRTKHKFGDNYYWILYYTYLSSQEQDSVNDVIDILQSHLKYISYRTYYRYRNETIEALSSLLWGYTSRDCLDLLDKLVPEKPSSSDAQ